MVLAEVRDAYALFRLAGDWATCGNAPSLPPLLCSRRTTVRRITFAIAVLCICHTANSATGAAMSDAILTCPECGSDQVACTAEQMFMANSGDHYCHSVKDHDSNAQATCLACRWTGQRKDLIAAPGSADHG